MRFIVSLVQGDSTDLPTLRILAVLRVHNEVRGDSDLKELTSKQHSLRAGAARSRYCRYGILLRSLEEPSTRNMAVCFCCDYYDPHSAYCESTLLVEVSTQMKLTKFSEYLGIVCLVAEKCDTHSRLEPMELRI